MRYALISALALCAVAAQAIPQATAKRKIPCKTPENAASCYWTHGRLAFYNGNPPYRLWKIGTKRVLGIFSGPSIWPPHDQRDQFSPELPANLERVFRPPNSRIFADFEVCPLDLERAGWMQDACIESTKNIFVQQLK